jgi:lambda family phage tail tape measure protein
MANNVDIKITVSTANVDAVLSKLKTNLQGVDTSVKTVNTQQQVGGNINNNLAKSVGSLDTGWSKYRTTLGLTLRQMNPLINSTFDFIRTLARLRTIFFLFLTVFAVRPAIRVFEEFAKGSTEFQKTLEQLNANFDVMKEQIGTKLAPLFRAIALMIDIVKIKLLQIGVAIVPAIAGLSVYAVRIFNVFKSVAYGLKSAFVAIDLYFSKGTQEKIDEQKTAIAKYTKDLEKLYALQKRGVEYATDPQSWWGKSEPITDLINNTIDLMGRASREIESLEHGSNAAADAAIKKAMDTLGEDMAAAAEAWGADPDKNPFVIMLNDVSEKLTASGVDKDLENALQDLLDNLAGKVKDNGKNAAGEWATGFKVGFAKYQRTLLADVTQLAEGIAQALETGLGDTFLNIMEGKFNKFKDIVVSTLRAVQKAIADFLAREAVGAILKQVIGPIAQGAVGLFTPSAGGGTQSANTIVANNPGLVEHASGGIVYNPSVSQVAEHGPEAIIPLQYLNSRKSGGNTVIFNINTVDGQSTAAFFNQHQDKIINIVNRGITGGSQSMRTAFGKK